MHILRKLTYKLYRATSSVKHWVRTRFTKVGLSMLGAAFVAGCMSFETEQKVTYQAFCLLSVLLCFSVVLGLRFQMKFQAIRVLPEFASVGVPVRYRFEIRNLTRRSQVGLYVLDAVEDPRPTQAEFIRWQIAEEKRRRPFHLGKKSNWPWVAKYRLGSSPTVNLPPLGKVEASLEITPLSRGFLRFKSCQLARPDPFGLFQAMARVPTEQSLLVLPRRYAVPRHSLPGIHRFQQGGVALAGSVGESEEFVSLRDYRRGDPLRRLHWKSWARTGRPIVKEFQEEFFVRHALILDTFLEPGASTQVFEEAVSVAASYACTIDTQESLLDLLFVGAQAYCFTSGRGLARTEQMLEILASVSICLDKPFSFLEGMVLQHVSAVSGCVFIFVKWDDDRRKLVQKVRGLGVPLVLYLVTDPDEPLGEEEILKNQIRVLRTGTVENDLNQS